MKSVDYYMKLSYKMEINSDTSEQGYVISFPELPGCITCGETLESALANAEDCKREWLTAALEMKISIPIPKNFKNS
jgi:predicted RNase H-like HicB family nuclease